MPNNLTDAEIVTINIEKYATALNNLIGVDSAYYQGDKDVDAIIEIITIAKKQETLINHLKAEIERLRGEIIEQHLAIGELVKQTKAEAYKERIEKVENIICDNTYPDFDKDGKAVNIWKAQAYKDLNNLLNELVGE